MAESGPTPQAYHELQHAYEHFNAALFEAALPACLTTLQREKLCYGYFSSKRFGNLQGQVTDEFALNPSFFAVVSLGETMQTATPSLLKRARNMKRLVSALGLNRRNRAGLRGEKWP